MKEILSQLQDILIKTIKNEKLILFHESSKLIVKLINQTQTKQWSKVSAVSKSGVNALIVKKGYYHMYNEGHKRYVMKLFFGESLKQHSRIERNKLLHLIKRIKEVIQKDYDNPPKDHKDSKFAKFYRAVFQEETAVQFYHDFFHYMISTAKENYSFKYTRFIITITAVTMKFIIAKNDTLKHIMSCFDYVEARKLKKGHIKPLKKLITLIYSHGHDHDFDKVFLENNISHELKDFYNKINITDMHVQKILTDYLKKIIYESYRRNRIYVEEIKDEMKKHVTDETKKRFYEHINKIRKQFVLYGHYIVNIMSDELSAFNVEQKGNDKYSALYLTIHPELVASIIKSQRYKEPMLLETELSKNTASLEKDVDHILHENARIKIKVLDKNYIHRAHDHAKLSVNTHYLIKFLTFMNNGLKDDEVESLYNINYSLLDKIGTLHPKLKILIEDIKIDLRTNFEERKSGLTKIEYVNKKMQEYIYKDNTTDEQLKTLWKSYKVYIHDMLNQASSRKLQLIDLINNAIRHCLFKYFICRTFYNSRSRGYLAADALNILTNPLGKLFVNIYDPNEGGYPDANILAHVIWPKLRPYLVERLSKIIESAQTTSYRYLHVEQIIEYIKSYLTISVSQVENLIKGSESVKYRDDKMLLDYLKTVIIKKKKLFYVHSLIVYEQLRMEEKHNVFLCNYVQKDASSSGFQVMSTFFRHPELAKMSNLMGTEDYNIYKRGTDYCYKTYNKIRAFSEEALKCFNSSKDIITNLISVELKRYEVEDLYDKKFTLPELLDLIIHLELEKEKDKKKKKIKEQKMKKKPYKILEILHIIISHIEQPVKTRLSKLFEAQYSDLSENLPERYQHLIFNYGKRKSMEKKKTLEIILCLKYAIYMEYIAENIIGLPHTAPSLWFERDLTKNHVMTTIYRSTAWGRRKTYTSLILEKHLIPSEKHPLVKEFSYFLEKSTTIFLQRNANIDLMEKFSTEVCTKGPFIIKNRNFEITINPHPLKKFQVSCTSFSRKRGPQLVIKQDEEGTDIEKLQTMVMANLAHSMDSDIMHHFKELVHQINVKTKYFYEQGKKIPENSNAVSYVPFYYKFVTECNHDCFILSWAPLLPILIEEAYLRFCAQDNIRYIQGISEENVQKFTSLTVAGFLDKLNPINPNFIKF